MAPFSPVSVKVIYQYFQYDVKEDMFDNSTKWLFEEWASIEDLRAHFVEQQKTGIPGLGDILACGPQFIICQF